MWSASGCRGGPRRCGSSRAFLAFSTTLAVFSVLFRGQRSGSLGLQRGTDAAHPPIAWLVVCVGVSSTFSSIFRALAFGSPSPPRPRQRTFIPPLGSTDRHPRNGCCCVPGLPMPIPPGAGPPPRPSRSPIASPRSLYIRADGECRSCCATPGRRDNPPHHFHLMEGRDVGCLARVRPPLVCKPFTIRARAMVVGRSCCRHRDTFGLRLVRRWPAYGRGSHHRGGPWGRPHPGGNRKRALLRHQPKIPAIVHAENLHRGGLPASMEGHRPSLCPSPLRLLLLRHTSPRSALCRCISMPGRRPG